MAKFHFVEDYEKHVKTLIRQHPIDEAMSLAVGGNFEKIGRIEYEIMLHSGLENGHGLIDFGCGSGRLGAFIGKNLKVDYLGLDVVQSLLDYAKTKCPKNFRFLLSTGLSIPMKDRSVDFVSVFSVFTHLLHHESYIFLEDMFRCLRPGGKVVMSFIEFAESDHFHIFEATIAHQRNSTQPHLNQFIERNQIRLWADRIGYAAVDFIDSAESVGDGGALGQSVAILTKGPA